MHSALVFKFICSILVLSTTVSTFSIAGSTLYLPSDHDDTEIPNESAAALAERAALETIMLHCCGTRRLVLALPDIGTRALLNNTHPAMVVKSSSKAFPLARRRTSELIFHFVRVRGRILTLS
jgi:hypothetical protein